MSKINAMLPHSTLFLKILIDFHHSFLLSHFSQAVVPETVPLGFPVLTVAATDFESSKNISYRILSSSKEFTIDPINGELFKVH